MRGPGLGVPRGKNGEILNRVFSSDGGWAIARSSAHHVCQGHQLPVGQLLRAGSAEKGALSPRCAPRASVLLRAHPALYFADTRGCDPASQATLPSPRSLDPLWLFQGQEAGPPQPRPLRWRGVASGVVVVYGRGGPHPFPGPAPPPKRALGRRRGTALLGRARVRLELDELLGHLIVASLRQDAQHCEPRVVHVDAAAERQPARGAPTLDQLPQLQHRQPHRAVLACEAVVLHAYLQLVALRARVGAQGAVGKDRLSERPS